MTSELSIGLVGARGHTGRILVDLITAHPVFRLAWASSRALAGEPVPGAPALRLEDLSPDDITKRSTDIVILALPDGAGAAFETAIAEDTVLLDLSADHRFDGEWVYGLPELYDSRSKLSGARRIANPGCYATAAQLALAPLLGYLSGPPSIFGVSGYSGAGTTPSPRNDPDLLRDNLLPYALTGHKHEREIGYHLDQPVRFTPHVHPAFSGLLATVHAPVPAGLNGADLRAIYQTAYADEPLVHLQEEPPTLADGTGINGVRLGGFSSSADGAHAVVVAAEDNLRKGAAVQAIQNLNLAFGLAETSGIAITNG